MCYSHVTFFAAGFWTETHITGVIVTGVLLVICIIAIIICVYIHSTTYTPVQTAHFNHTLVQPSGDRGTQQTAGQNQAAVEDGSAEVPVFRTTPSFTQRKFPRGHYLPPLYIPPPGGTTQNLAINIINQAPQWISGTNQYDNLTSLGSQPRSNVPTDKKLYGD